MLRTIAAVIALCLVLVLPACNNAHAQDEKDLKKLQETFTECENTSNGARMVPLLSDASFALYDRLRKVGLDGSERQVRGLPPGEQVEVLMMRAKAKRADLVKLDGKGYVEFVASRGWYADSFEDQADEQLKHFKFAGDSADAELYMDGEASGLRMHYVKEGGVWKVDEPANYEELSRFMARKSGEAGIPVADFIEMILEKRAPDADIDSLWGPMK